MRSAPHEGRLDEPRGDFDGSPDLMKTQVRDAQTVEYLSGMTRIESRT
jgi:hypothetical protein